MTRRAPGHSIDPSLYTRDQAEAALEASREALHPDNPLYDEEQDQAASIAVALAMRACPMQLDGTSALMGAALAVHVLRNIELYTQQ